MAEQATAEKDKAKQAASAAVPAKIKGGLIGPLLAGVVLVGAGVGLGMWLSSLVKGVQQEVAAAAAVESKPGDGHGKGDAKSHGADDKSKPIADQSEVAMPDLVSNVRNQQGRRYIKVTCSFWMATAQIPQAGLAEGGTGATNIKRMVQMSLEEHLKNYDLDELTGPNIYLQLKRGFKDQIEKTLRELHPDLPREHELVSRVVLTNLLVQ